MKTLLLARHAKSDWNSAAPGDFERPLNARGLNDAPLMAEQLRLNGINLEQVISSDATRAQSTAEYYANILTPQVPLLLDHELYLASSAEIKGLARSLDDRFNSVMLVAHNPGMTEAVEDFCRAGIDNLPTCGVAIIQFDVTEWKHIAKQYASLIAFEYPKKYR